MRVWIVNYYTGTPDKVSNPRYIQLAKHFMAAGYDVLTINANHTWDETNKPPLLEFKNYGEYKFVHVRARKYVGNGLRRMLSIYQFAQDVKHHSKKIGKPDIVLHNIHPPFDYPIVGMAKKIGAKWRGNGDSLSHPASQAGVLCQGIVEHASAEPAHHRKDCR